MANGERDAAKEHLWRTALLLKSDPDVLKVEMPVGQGDHARGA